ncbi:uncharacterized protein LOC62_02G002673 [Vanrija pseudolonga]|uniref:Tautomerase cis-CaaD-like domain-containing protein n=1 Tax=Vanrija pseudolonga TaxID=143232 RepID=A0AAF0Y2Y7_9TREE|nr:hypothetical protein LOC62_02G002673 [Vanrija pseudolonga]
MPTYIVKAPPGLTAAQKSTIAQAITDRHHEATGAPRFFAQVVIEEDGPAQERHLGGVPAASANTKGHIWVHGNIRSGRSKSVKETLALSIMRDIAQIADLNEAFVWVYLSEIAPTNMVEYGRVLPPPGGEEDWFASLPYELAAQLESMGTTRGNFVL